MRDYLIKPTKKSYKFVLVKKPTVIYKKLKTTCSFTFDQPKAGYNVGTAETKCHANINGNYKRLRWFISPDIISFFHQYSSTCTLVFDKTTTYHITLNVYDADDNVICSSADSISVDIDSIEKENAYKLGYADCTLGGEQGDIRYRKKINIEMSI